VAGLLDITPGTAVALIGVVNPLVAAIRERGGVCLPCDLNLRTTQWGERVSDDMTEVLAAADAVVATGMTLSNGTFDLILEHCRDQDIPLVVYAQTGSAVARAFLSHGVTALNAEPFPFSQFRAEPTLMHRYRLPRQVPAHPGGAARCAPTHPAAPVRPDRLRTATANRCRATSRWPAPCGRCCSPRPSACCRSPSSAPTSYPSPTAPGAVSPPSADCADSAAWPPCWPAPRSPPSSTGCAGTGRRRARSSRWASPRRWARAGTSSCWRPSACSSARAPPC